MKTHHVTHVIQSVKGNRNEMLRLEKDFIDEKYTPFNFNGKVLDAFLVD